MAFLQSCWVFLLNDVTKFLHEFHESNTFKKSLEDTLLFLILKKRHGEEDQEALIQLVCLETCTNCWLRF